jgi:hypothetical protein
VVKWKKDSQKQLGYTGRDLQEDARAILIAIIVQRMTLKQKFFGACQNLLSATGDLLRTLPKLTLSEHVDA